MAAVHTPKPVLLKPPETLAERFWSIARGMEGDADAASTDPVKVVRHVLRVLDALSEGQKGEGLTVNTVSFLALLRQHELMGDLVYASPEQARGEVVDERSLVFSVGVLIFEKVTGRHPFGAEGNPRRIARIQKGELGSGVSYFPKIPAGLRTILLRAMGPFPEDRWPSLRALRAKLEEFVLLEGTARAGVGDVQATAMELSPSPGMPLEAKMALDAERTRVFRPQVVTLEPSGRATPAVFADMAGKSAAHAAAHADMAGPPTAPERGLAKPQPASRPAAPVAGTRQHRRLAGTPVPEEPDPRAEDTTERVARRGPVQNQPDVVAPRTGGTAGLRRAVEPALWALLGAGLASLGFLVAGADSGARAGSAPVVPVGATSALTRASSDAPPLPTVASETTAPTASGSPAPRPSPFAPTSHPATAPATSSAARGAVAPAAIPPPQAASPAFSTPPMPPAAQTFEPGVVGLLAIQEAQGCFDEMRSFGAGLLLTTDGAIRKVYFGAQKELTPAQRRCVTARLTSFRAPAAPDKNRIVEYRFRVGPNEAQALVR